MSEMEIDFNQLKGALEHPREKASRKYLSELAETMQGEEPERYAAILNHSFEDSACAAAQARYRTASRLTKAALALAALVVIAAYILGEFGTAALTGWGNRYLLAGAVLLGMGVLVLAGAFCGRRRAILIASALLHEEEGGAAK